MIICAAAVGINLLTNDHCRPISTLLNKIQQRSHQAHRGALFRAFMRSLKS